MAAQKKVVVEEFRKFGSSRPLVENMQEAFTQYGGSKYEMIIIAAARARQLAKGQKSLVSGNHKPVVQALLEVQAGHIQCDK